jgi:hypothetical protein
LDEVLFIDKENVPNYTYTKYKEKSFDIVSKHNDNLAATEFFYNTGISGPDASDIFISFLCGILIIKFPELIINVVSKDHFAN